MPSGTSRLLCSRRTKHGFRFTPAGQEFVGGGQDSRCMSTDVPARRRTGARCVSARSGSPSWPRRRCCPPTTSTCSTPLRAGRRPARPDRGGPARDRGRRHDRDPPRCRLGRPRAGPVRPHRHRRRRRAPVARLLPHPRAARRRPDLDHRQGRPRRQGEQPPGAPGAGPGTLVHLEQAAGEFVLPTDGRQVPLRHRRLRRHPGDRDAAQPLPGHATAAPSGCRAASATTSSSSTSRPSEPQSIFIDNLRALDDAGLIRLVARYDDQHGVLDVADLASLVPDLAERTTFACGPARAARRAAGAPRPSAGCRCSPSSSG